MRAVLFAKATATTRLGRRRRSPITHGSALVAFELSRLVLAPLIRRRRKYRLPRLKMPPRRDLPPVECCRGTDPATPRTRDPCGTRLPRPPSRQRSGNDRSDPGDGRQTLTY